MKKRTKKVTDSYQKLETDTKKLKKRAVAATLLASTVAMAGATTAEAVDLYPDSAVTWTGSAMLKAPDEALAGKVTASMVGDVINMEAQGWTAEASSQWSLGRGVFTNMAKNGDSQDVLPTGAFSMADSSFLNNQSEYSGGAMNIWHDGGAASTSYTNSISNTSFTNNAAGLGGAIGTFAMMDFAKSDTLNLYNVTFSGNSATAKIGDTYAGGEKLYSEPYVGGGAIFADNTTINITGTSSFESNTSAVDGGAINLAHGTSVNANGTTFTGNTAVRNGGAINVTSGNSVNLENASFTNNAAGGLGGAIYNEGTVTLNGNATFTGNTANSESNDIYNDGTLNFNNATAGDENATTISLGGGITGSIDGENNVGSIIINAASTDLGIVQTSGTIQNQDITVSHGEYIFDKNTTLDNSTITVGSNATINTIDNAINNYVDTITLTNGAIIKGDIDYAAGTADLYSAAANASVTYKVANALGKDIQYGQTKTIKVAEGQNVSVNADSTTWYGDNNKALSVSSTGAADGSVNITGKAGGINGAVEEADGSGAKQIEYVVTTSADSYHSETDIGRTISNANMEIKGDADKTTGKPNKAIQADSNAKGFIVANTSTVKAKDVEFKGFGQTAADDGQGTVFTNNGTTEFDNAKFTSNAGENIVNTVNSTLKVKNSEFDGSGLGDTNRRAISTAGTYTNDDNDIHDYTMTYGAGLKNTGTATPLGDHFYNNTATETSRTTDNGGGAIWNSGTLTLGSSTSRSTLFENNTSATDGGAIYNAAGTATISDATFIKNTASSTNSGQGGGIYNKAGATLILNNVTFGDGTAANANSAVNGGAIYNAGTATINGGTFNGNTATANGGAIYSAANLTINSDTTNGSALFQNNTANSAANDIYMQGTSDSARVTLNLKAVDNTRTITLGSGLAGQYYDVNVNNGGGATSTVNINNMQGANTLTLNSGILNLTSSSVNSDTAKLSVVGAATLNATKGLTATELVVADDTTFSNSGNLTVSGTLTNGHTTPGTIGTIKNTGTITLTGSNIENVGSITSDSTGNLVVAGADADNKALLTNNGTITNNEISINQYATLTTQADDISDKTGTISNAGVLELLGDTAADPAGLAFANSVSGGGTTKVTDGLVTVGSSYNINQAIQILTDGTNAANSVLALSADNVKGNVTMNDGNDNYDPILRLTGGTLSNNIYKATNAGDLEITGAVTIAEEKSVEVSGLKVDSTKTLTNNGNIKVHDELSNAGTITNNTGASELNLLGGDSTDPMENEGTINGIGKINIGSYTNSTENDPAYVVNSGSMTGEIKIAQLSTLKSAANSLNDINGIENRGTLNLTGSGTSTPINLASAIKDTTSPSPLTGVTNIQGNVATNEAITQLTLNIGSDGTNDVAGSLTSNSTITSTVRVSNKGSFTNSSSVTGNITVEGAGSTLGQMSNAGTINGNLTNSGTVGNRGTVTGNLTNSGTFDNFISTNNGTVQGNVVNNYGGTITTLAGNIATADGKTITNDGSLILTGGTLGKNIGQSGTTGTTTLQGTTIVDTSVTITQSGGVTVSDTTGSGVQNKGTINANLTNTGTVSNTGTIKGDLTNSGTVTITGAGEVEGSVVNTAGTITTSASKIATGGSSTITNDDTLSFTGGTISKNIAKVTSGNGTVEIAGDVSITKTAAITDNTITLASGGTFDVTAKHASATDGTIDISGLGSGIVANGGTLSVQDGLTGTTTLGSVDLSGGSMNLKIDANFTAGEVWTDHGLTGTADKLVLTTDPTGYVASTKDINISDIAIAADPIQTEFRALIADDSAKAYLDLTATKLTGLTDGAKNITLSYDKGTGYLTGVHSTLADAIESTITTKLFNMGSDAKIDALTLKGTSLSVTGNDHSISSNAATAQTANGIDVNGKTLTINGATIGGDNTTTKGFMTALDNTDGGNVTLSGVTMTGNSLDIDNSGASAGVVNLNGVTMTDAITNIINDGESSNGIFVYGNSTINKIADTKSAANPADAPINGQVTIGNNDSTPDNVTIGTIMQKNVNVLSDGILNIDADKLIVSDTTNGTANAGTLNLKGGSSSGTTKTTASVITGNGTTNITDYVTVGKAITQGTLNVGTVVAAVETPAHLVNDSTITATNATVTAGSTLTNNSGKTFTINTNNLTNYGTITNNGTINGNGTVDNKANATINNLAGTSAISAAIVNEANGTVNSIASGIQGGIDNDGILNLSGDITTTPPVTTGVLASAITSTNGTGVTNVDGTVSTNGKNVAQGEIVVGNNGTASTTGTTFTVDGGSQLSTVTSGGASGDVTVAAGNTFEISGKKPSTTTYSKATIAGDLSVGTGSNLNIVDGGELAVAGTATVTNGNLNLKAINDDVTLTQAIAGAGTNGVTVNVSGGNISTVDAAITNAVTPVNVENGATLALNDSGSITSDDGTGSQVATTILLKDNGSGANGANLNVNSTTTRTFDNIVTATAGSGSAVTVNQDGSAGRVILDTVLSGVDDVNVAKGTAQIGVADDGKTSTSATLGTADLNIATSAVAEINAQDTATRNNTYTVDNDVTATGTGALNLNGNGPATRYSPTGDYENKSDSDDVGTTFSVAPGTTIKDTAAMLTNGQLNIGDGTAFTGTSEIYAAADTTTNAMDGVLNTIATPVNFADGAYVKGDANILTGQTDKYINATEAGNEYLTDLDIKGADWIVHDSASVNLSTAMGLNNMKHTEALVNNLDNKYHHVMTPIRRLDGTVTTTTDGVILSFVPTGNSYKDGDFNPAVMNAPVATAMGYLTQLNSYDQAFRNMDMYMLMTSEQRQAMKLKNKYADVAANNLVYDQTGNIYDNTALWFNPYSTFETVQLNHGPDVNNVSYGSFFGGDSKMYDLGKGWDGMYSIYFGYNGSHQTYQGNSIYQNGGTFGVAGMLFKNNFFFGATANIGGSGATATNMYGHEDFGMLMTGASVKTGYNWELFNGKFIIQPSYMMSYSFVNTFDYTNSAGVKMESNPLNALHFEPGIKFIGNFKNGWQPYAGISVVWNALDKAAFDANDVKLPDLCIKPYVKYGIGLRKIWGERFTGYLQAYFTGGGRNGVGLQAGFRWTLGKSEAPSAKMKNKLNTEKTNISLSSVK